MKTTMVSILSCLVVLLSSTTLGIHDVDRLAFRAVQIQQQKMKAAPLPSPLIGDDLFSKELSGGHIQSGEMLEVLDEFAQIERIITANELPLNTKLTLQSVSTYFKSANNEVFITTDIDDLDHSLVWYTNKLDGADEQLFSSFVSAPLQVSTTDTSIQISNLASFLQETCPRFEVEEYVLLAPKPCLQRFPFVNNTLNISEILNSWFASQSKDYIYNQDIRLQLFKNHDNEFAFVITQNNSESQTVIQTILTYLH